MKLRIRGHTNCNVNIYLPSISTFKVSLNMRMVVIKTKMENMNVQMGSIIPKLGLKYITIAAMNTPTL